jgi:hypothetical protein
MNKRTIEILITPQGQVQIEAVGFKGPDCERATAFLEAALGAVATKQKTPEFHQTLQKRQQQRLGG